MGEYTKLSEELKLSSYKLSDDAERVFHIAREYAKEVCHASILPAHLLKALLHKEIGLAAWLERLGKDYYYLLEWADVQISLYPKTGRVADPLFLDTSSLTVVKEAENYQAKGNLDELTPVCLLASLVTPGVGFTFEQLKLFPLTVPEVMEHTSSPSRPEKAAGYKPQSSFQSVQKYCINKNEQVMRGEIDPVIGFEHEIAIMFEVLGRKTKSNLLVTGESGVGKTSLINGFVHRLTASDVPGFLCNATVFELDLASITAEAGYKGEVEDRIKKVLNELQSQEQCILVIESVDKLLDKQSPFNGGGQILKQALSKGNLLLICTSSIDGFTKHIETDKEFVRKFEKITLEEPNAEQCFRILKGAIGLFEKYHDLTVTDPVIHDAIRLSKRYLNEKSLPDAGFDLIDRTMALIRTLNDMAQKDIRSIREKWAQLEEKAKATDEVSVITELNWLHYELFSKVSCLLIAQLDDDTDFAKIETLADRFHYLQTVLDQLQSLATHKRTHVDAADLYAVIAKQTGIPLGKIQSKERDKLIQAESILKKRVVGQDHAIKIILDAVYESRSGLNKKGQPMGSFFFLGPTGTGKTELAKALAEFLFQDETAMLRFDMSEFKEEHSVALLYGAPPGYVGYEEGGLLVNQIRQKPYAVVLFDEIEKAHRSVFDLFLQILSDGKLHDRLGRVGDFSNALILFTSNIGSQFIVDAFQKGSTPQNNDLLDLMQEYFRPEFLGRLTEIVPFAPITEKIATLIFDIHLKELLKSLEEKHISLEITSDAKQAIVMSGFNAQFGARPIIGTIRKELRRPLSKMLISGELKGGSKVILSIENNELIWKF